MKLEHRLSLSLNFAWIFILYSHTLKQHRAERIKTVYVWSFSFKSARCATVSQLVFFYSQPVLSRLYECMCSVVY